MEDSNYDTTPETPAVNDKTHDTLGGGMALPSTTATGDQLSATAVGQPSTTLGQLFPKVGAYPEFGYWVAAPQYAAKGFEVVPCQPDGKAPQPKGSTGRGGRFSTELMNEWRQRWPERNTAIRSDGTWIGFDEDNYNGKDGRATRLQLEAEVGVKFPPTIRSTARGSNHDGGISFYRIPAGTPFLSALRDVEIVQRHHRVAVVEPSQHYTGGVYQWYGPDGQELDDLPSPDDFAELPIELVERLKVDAQPDWYSGEWDGDLGEVRSHLSDGDVDQRVLDQIATYDCTSHDGSVRALFAIAWWVVNQPNTNGLETAIQNVMDARMGKQNASTPPEHRQNDLNRALEGALARHQATYDVQQGGLATVAPTVATPTTPRPADPTFWETRPILQRIRQMGRCTAVSPWGLLGYCIEHALLSVPFRVGYKTAQGTARLNAVQARIGLTGQGKTLSDNIGAEIFEFPNSWRWQPEIEPGSGEAISDSYKVRKKNESGVMVLEWVDVWNHAQLFTFDEVGAMAARQNRQGTTIVEVLKQAESGSALGRKLAGNGGLMLEKGTYRFCMHINTQPSKAGVFLDDSAVSGGLPGRLLWLNVANPHARRDWIDAPMTVFKVPEPFWEGVGQIDALPQMIAAHLENLFDANEGKVDPLDSHAVLTRAKVAIAFMVLDGRTVLNTEDWVIAGQVMDHSNDTRTMVIEAVAAERAAANRQAGKARGKFNIAAKEVELDHHEQAINRVKGLLQAFLDENPGKSPAAARRALASRDRPLFDEIKDEFEAEI